MVCKITVQALQDGFIVFVAIDEGLTGASALHLSHIYYLESDDEALL